MDFDVVVFRLLMPVHHSRWRALHPHIMGDIAVAWYVPIPPIGHKRAHKCPSPSSAGVRRCAVGGDGDGDDDGDSVNDDNDDADADNAASEKRLETKRKKKQNKKLQCLPM